MTRKNDNGEFSQSALIGAIQIIIRATFREGLDTPITLAILDNRIINKQEATLGILKGNLKYRKLIFTIHPKFNDRQFNNRVLIDSLRLFGIHDIEIDSLLDNSLNKEILLGSNFLEKVKPWKTSSNDLTFYIDHHVIKISK